MIIRCMNYPLPGTSSCVNAALSMIREKFPPKRFQHICYDRINVPQDITPEITQVGVIFESVRSRS